MIQAQKESTLTPGVQTLLRRKNEDKLMVSMARMPQREKEQPRNGKAMPNLHRYLSGSGSRRDQGGPCKGLVSLVGQARGQSQKAAIEPANKEKLPSLRESGIRRNKGGKNTIQPPEKRRKSRYCENKEQSTSNNTPERKGKVRIRPNDHEGGWGSPPKHSPLMGRLT